MTVTVTCQNVAGSASNIGFFFWGWTKSVVSC